MTEPTPEAEYDYRESELTSFVFDRIADVNDLNAEGELEADEVFRTKLWETIRGLKRKEFAKPGSDMRATNRKAGFFYTPSNLSKDGTPVRVILKKMTWNEESPASQERLFERDEKQTLLCVSFFGPRFIPHTEFFRRKKPGGATEYYIAQDEVEGIQYKRYRDDRRSGRGEVHEFSPQIKREAIAFVRKYIEFHRTTGNILDLDMMIDTERGRLQLFDASNFRSERAVNFSRQLTVFIEHLGIGEDVPKSEYENLLRLN